MADQDGTATVRDLADRHGITSEAMHQWLSRHPHLQPANTGRPRRYSVAAVDATRGAAGLIASRDIPPGMGTTSALAQAVGRHQTTVLDALRRPDAPKPAGHVRGAGGGPPTAYYLIGGFTAWYQGLERRSDRRSATRQVGAEIEARIAPDKSPHGSEYRYKKLRCRCPVCQSARAAARAHARGVTDRVPAALHDLVRTLLDPAVDAEEAAAMVAAAAHPERIRILRLVASAWPDPVPRAVLRRLLGGEDSEHFRHLEDAGLLAREQVMNMGLRVDMFRFVKPDSVDCGTEPTAR